MKRFETTPEDQIEDQKQRHVKKGKYTTGRTGRRHAHIKIIKKNIPAVKSILAIGSRSDNEVLDFKKATFDVVAIDICRGTEQIIQMDAHDIADHFQPNEFDLVYASHSLEHMHTVDTVLSSIRSISKYGLFVVLPQYHNIQPSIDHPSVFDLMMAPTVKDIASLRKQMHLMDDFSLLGDFNIITYKQLAKRKEFDMLLKWQ